MTLCEESIPHRQIKLTLIGSGNVLLLSGNMPLPDPKLTKFYDAMWRHWGTQHANKIALVTDNVVLSPTSLNHFSLSY